jgi:glycosyltransferase involved in cell wall biosynthesis
MVKNSYPRILVISPVKFNQQTGSGVTMGNLFRGWPLQSIAQIHSENWTEADTEICHHYYHLPYKQIRHQSRLRMAIETSRQITRFTFNRQETLLGHFVHRKALLSWCQRFNPDLIYTRPLDRPSFSIWLPIWLSKHLSTPTVTRILDDWPSRIEHDPVLLRRFYWRTFLQRNFKLLLRRSAINIGISEEMSKEFQIRYKTRFITYHNCVDFSEWQPEKQDHSSNDIFEIIYMGSVIKDKELQSLLDIKKVILNLSKRGYQIRFTVYGPERYAQVVREQIEVLPLIKFGGFFPVREKFKILKDADLLVLPINFDLSSRSYLGYSFQTKVPEYMASGTPILVYGPSQNPNIRYANEYNWAAIVDKRDMDFLNSTLERLINDQELRRNLGVRARKLAFQNHNADNIRPQFQQTLIDLATHKQDPYP